MLEIKNLSVKYKNIGKPILERVSFSVEKGEIIAILGPSGCGKTTLLNILSGLLTEKKAEIAGTFQFNGGKKVRVNYVFQAPTLLPWRTVEKNIIFGMEIKKISQTETDKRTAEVIRVIGLSDFSHYYPHQLSIGMQQRINFARALVCEPDILFLDEPFSALDRETKKKIQEEFLKIIKNKKITTLFVTHSVEEAVFLADRIIVLSKNPTRVKNIFKNSSVLAGTEKAMSMLEFYEE